MIHFPREDEFLERRRQGERRRVSERRRLGQARRRGEAEGPATAANAIFTNLGGMAPEPPALYQPVDTLPPRRGEDPRARPRGETSLEALGEAAKLRRQAEEAIRLEALLDLCEAMSPEATEQILHELRVHQIELEMQNEELRRAQMELATAKSRYFDLYDRAPVGYCTLDGHNLILEANLTMATLLGVVRSALVTRPISQFILPEDQDVYYLSLKRLLETGSPQECELQMLKGRGETFWALLEFTLAQEVDGPVCRLVMSDITQRKRMEADHRQFQKAESLGRMAGAIAHHFNNQIQGVMSSLEMLGELPRGADPAKYLALGTRACERAAEVSRMMLVYLGQTCRDRAPQLLSELCRGSLSRIQLTLPDTVTLECDFPSPGPVVLVDAEQIQQVLSSLVTNAWEAMGEGGGLIRLALRTSGAADIPTAHRHPVGWEPQEPDYACLEVADTGCGIPDADIERLFDPFFSTRFSGRGLGLPMVLGIVQAHGGAVTVKSRPGQGSTFQVHLPVIREMGS